jgi:hypothetical protein
MPPISVLQPSSAVPVRHAHPFALGIGQQRGVRRKVAVLRDANPGIAERRYSCCRRKGLVVDCRIMEAFLPDMSFFDSMCGLMQPTVAILSKVLAIDWSVNMAHSAFTRTGRWSRLISSGREFLIRNSSTTLREADSRLYCRNWLPPNLSVHRLNQCESGFQHFSWSCFKVLNRSRASGLRPSAPGRSGGWMLVDFIRVSRQSAPKTTQCSPIATAADKQVSV